MNIFKNYPARISFGRRLCIGLLAIIASAMSLTATAQSVTISPETGHLLAGLNNGYEELGFKDGWQSLWQHEQLPLTLITYDEAVYKEGLPTSHACNMKLRDKKEDGTSHYAICAMSNSNNGYFTIALPNGYKITRYTIEYKAVEKDAPDVIVNNRKVTQQGVWTLTEVDENGTALNTAQQVSYSDNQTYTRSASTVVPMNNVLHFRIATGGVYQACCS